MELWYFGMSSAVHGWVGGGGLLEDQLQFGWLCSSRCDLIKSESQKILRSWAKRGSSFLITLLSRPRNKDIGTNSPQNQNQHLLFTKLYPSVLLCSGWFHLSLAQWLCLHPASLCQPFVCCCCVSVVQRRLQRTVLVVAGCAGLAAAVGVVV